MGKGDILLITFPFTDLSGTKLRPAVILAETGSDLTVCFITSQMQWHESTDLILNPTSTNGLKKLSLLRTSKIATLNIALARGFLGTLTNIELNDLDNSLKQFLQIP
ncbi:type II toxin-antitoxin system PemK/MazF family toxin [Mucilaginibacter sp. HD30]